MRPGRKIDIGRGVKYSSSLFFIIMAKKTARQQAMSDMTACGVSIEVLVKERIILEITSNDSIKISFRHLSGPVRKHEKHGKAKTTNTGLLSNK